MPKAKKSSYHHGDLQVALLEHAMAMLEAGESFSLRGVAGRIGVSPTAVYRHFADREAIESALAAQGLRDLFTALTSGDTVLQTPSDVAELAVRYVRFALDRPALFRLMFGRECDVDSPERVDAASRIHALLEATMQEVFPRSDASALASAGWALAHGMAFLHLDGKLPRDSETAVDERVRAAFQAILTAGGR